MKLIHKQVLPAEDHFALTLPTDARLLTLQTQSGLPCLWYEFDESEERTERRTFRTFGTGHQLPDDLYYIGTYQTQKGRFVWHVYETDAPPFGTMPGL